MEFPTEMCVNVGELENCISGEILIAAIILECCFYFVAFVFGVKLIDKFRKKIRGEKHSGKKIRQDLLRKK